VKLLAISVPSNPVDEALAVLAAGTLELMGVLTTVLMIVSSDLSY
jgi:hypothetical protein